VVAVDGACIKTGFLLIAGVCALSAAAVAAAADDGHQQASDSSLAASSVASANEEFWAAFNACNGERMAGLFTANVEFYHDREGMNQTRDVVAASMLAGPCDPSSEYRLRREAIEGSEQFHPLAGGFALLSGEHRFFARQLDGPERHDTMASFHTIWELGAQGWQMRRIISFDHRPDIPQLVPVRLSESELSRFEGVYRLDEGNALPAKVIDGTLILGEGPRAFELVPLSAGLFGVEGRWLQFRFSDGRIEVLEEGRIVASGTRQPD
jgi:hypothetical protein